MREQMCLVGMYVKWKGMRLGEGCFRANADIKEDRTMKQSSAIRML